MRLETCLKAVLPLAAFAAASTAFAGPSFGGRPVAYCSQCTGEEACVGGSDGLHCFSSPRFNYDDQGNRQVGSCSELCMDLSDSAETDQTLEALDGEYVAEVDFGSGIMRDRVRFAHVDHEGQGPMLEGKYVVPGRFTAEVEEPVIEGYAFSFSIVAREGDRDERLAYELTYDPSTRTFSGEIDERGARIGSVRFERAR